MNPKPKTKNQNMTLTTDQPTWNTTVGELLAEMPLKEVGQRVAVKTLPRRNTEQYFGVIMQPRTVRGEVSSDSELAEHLLKSGGEVIVCGHGWGGAPNEHIVWRGTPEEFVENWIAD